MSTTSADERTARLRAALVDVVAREVSSARVLDVMRELPRHRFVPEHPVVEAYADHALPIGHGATISQPTIVGMMSAALALEGIERVLEIGTGSGYQAAVLGRLARSVDTMEVVPELARRARDTLTLLGITNVTVHDGDGWAGLPALAPFDRVVVTAAPDRLPPLLIQQLVEGGLLVAPVGPQYEDQRLERYTKRDGKLLHQDLGAVRFVPMIQT